MTDEGQFWSLPPNKLVKIALQFPKENSPTKASPFPHFREIEAILVRDTKVGPVTLQRFKIPNFLWERTLISFAPVADEARLAEQYVVPDN